MKRCGVFFCLFFTVCSNFTSSCMQTVIHQMLHSHPAFLKHKPVCRWGVFKGSDWREKKKNPVLFFFNSCVYTQTSRPELQLDGVHVTPLGFCLFGEMSKIRLTFSVDASSAARRLCVSLWTSCIFVFKEGGKCLTEKNVPQSKYSQCGKDQSGLIYGCTIKRETLDVARSCKAI